MIRWWRSHSLRVRLTLWYVVAMIVVLGLYAAAVYASVSRAASEGLDQRLRGDFQWAAAMIDRGPDGTVTGYDPESLGDDESPWIQVWTPEGELLYRSSEAQRRPLPETQALAIQAGDRTVRIPTDTEAVRVLSRRGRIDAQPVVIQVARWEAQVQQQVREVA